MIDHGGGSQAWAKRLAAECGLPLQMALGIEQSRINERGEMGAN
jgi:hypothetical protein